MPSEKRIEQEIMLAATECDCILFKNNVGSAYRGKMMMLNGKKVLTGLQFISYGLGGIKGSSDQIGIASVEITPDMVGKRVGIFTAIEVKKDKHGAYKATPEQRKFIQMVKANGGIAGVCDSVEDMKQLIKKGVCDV